MCPIMHYFVSIIGNHVRYMHCLFFCLNLVTTTSMEDDFKFTLEVHFAQRLAGNAPKARERTVKKLKRWISARSVKQGDVGMEEELMRLWKGLFYCMWMCDKPLVQEELADKIADLIHSFSTPQGAMGFFDAFLLTMKREWIGIDRLRMDKFFMFIRRCFRQALVVLRNNNWEDSVVDRFLDVLRKTPLSGNSTASADGLCYHFIDIYREEVALCAGQELTPEQVMKLIDPFCVLVTTAHSKTLLKVTLRGIFQEIIDESDVGFPDDSEDEGIDSGEDEKGDGKPDKAEDEDNDDKTEKKRKPARKELPKLKYNYQVIADRLFALASKKSTPGPYRRKIYAIVKKFRDLKEGVFPDYNVESLLSYQDDEDEFIYGDRPWLLKNLVKNKGQQQGQKRKATKEVARRDDDEGDGAPRRKRRRRRKKKHINKSAPEGDKEAKDVEAGETTQKPSKKEAGNDTADADTKTSEEVVTDKKKRKSRKRKSDGNQINRDEIKKTTDGDDSKTDVPEIKTSCETDGNDLEDSAEKPPKKLKKRKSKVLPLETTDKNQSNESSKTPEKTPEKIKKAEAAEAEPQVNLSAKKSQSPKVGGQRKTEKPFAAFQRTRTPPAFVRRATARKDGEPQTEPRRKKGILLSDDTDSDQATPKKRVKIALGLNKAHASKDYQKQLQESPGIPFDGSKQPTQSVLKTPSPKYRKATGKKPNTSTLKIPSPKPQPSVGKKSPTPSSRKQSSKSSSRGGQVKMSPKEKIMALRRSLRISRTKTQK